MRPGRLELLGQLYPTIRLGHAIDQERSNWVRGKIPVDLGKRPQLDMIDILVHLGMYELMLSPAENHLAAMEEAYNNKTSDKKPPLALYKFVGQLRQARVDFLSRTGPEVFRLVAHIVVDELAEGNAGSGWPAWLERSFAEGASTRSLIQAGKAGLSWQDFATEARRLFNDGTRWSPGYGGEKWGNVVLKLLLDYSTLELGTSLDLLFDLEHNGGKVIEDKIGAIWDPRFGKALLIWKGDITTMPTDFLALIKIADPTLHVPYALRELAERGAALGCWVKDPKPTALQLAQAHEVRPIQDVFYEAIASAKSPHIQVQDDPFAHPLAMAIHAQQARVSEAIDAARARLMASGPTDELVAVLRTVDASCIGPADYASQLAALRANDPIADCSHAVRQASVTAAEKAFDRFENDKDIGRLVRQLESIVHTIRVDAALDHFLNQYGEGGRSPEGEAFARDLRKVIDSLGFQELVPIQVNYPSVPSDKGDAAIETVRAAARDFRKDSLSESSNDTLERVLLEQWDKLQPPGSEKTWAL